MSRKKPSKTLAELARAYFEAHPDERPEALGSSSRPWDFAVDSLAKEIEKLRRQFPLERVQRAAEKLEYFLPEFMEPRKAWEQVIEQVYRAHYSSLKIRWSWHLAEGAVVALGELYGLNAPDSADSGDGSKRPREPEAEPDEKAAAARRAATCRQLWPDEHVEDLLALVEGESFWGHIPLRSGFVALGLRLGIHEYARSVVRVLLDLHENKPYTFGLCVGRILEWDEAMVFKTLPTPPAERPANP
jgi:hypothetical protein